MPAPPQTRVHAGAEALSIFKTPAEEDEKPLDPALLRVQAKMRRLMLVAGLTLGVGMLAVFVGVIYRAFLAPPAQRAAGLPAAPTAVTTARLTLSDLGLPPDARLTGTASNGSRVVLTFAYTGGNTLIFLDERLLTITGRLDLPGAP